MIDGLISGKVHARAVQRMGQSGRQFTCAKVLATTARGESVFCDVVAFDEVAQVALLALDAGDAVSLAGGLSPGVWTDKHGVAKPTLHVVANAVISVRMARPARRVEQSA